MESEPLLTGSIVLFNEKLDYIQDAVQSFLNTPMAKRLYLIDNSPTDILKDHFNHPDIVYKFLGKNIGFGKGHNLVIDQLSDSPGFHLIFNPDVNFKSSVIPNLIRVLESDNKLALVAPRVLFPDGHHQFTCRRFPSVFELLVRRSGIFRNVFKNIIERSEYGDKDLMKFFYPEAVHGCFQLFRKSDFLDLNGFDPRYFIYMEDLDICKEIACSDKRIAYKPDQIIIHHYQRGSSKNIKLLFHHILSVFQYFYKWGVINRNRKHQHD